MDIGTWVATVSGVVASAATSVTAAWAARASLHIRRLERQVDQLREEVDSGTGQAIGEAEIKLAEQNLMRASGVIDGEAAGVPNGSNVKALTRHAHELQVLSDWTQRADRLTTQHRNFVGTALFRRVIEIARRWGRFE